MTSKLPNPHYLPDVFIKSTVINFTVTFDGLEDQLLVDVVKHEAPDVEKQRDEIILSISVDRKVLKQCQDKILELLANSNTTTVLDDELLIWTLEESKNHSTEISRVLASSSTIEARVNQARDIYRPVATRGAVLYFVISDLGMLDPMYQYSLGYFKKLFNFSLEMEEPKTKLKERLIQLNNCLTRNLYTNISKGLFEAHKRIFAFLLCTSIHRNSGLINDSIWNLLIRGPGASVVASATEIANPDRVLFSRQGWAMIQQLANIFPHKLSILPFSIKDRVKLWREYSGSENIYQSDFPGDFLFLEQSHYKKARSQLENMMSFQVEMTHHTKSPRRGSMMEDIPSMGSDGTPSLEGYIYIPFLKLTLIKAIAPERFLEAVIHYIGDQMGPFFQETSPISLEETTSQSDHRTPIIFILSQGADPSINIINFAEETGKTLGVISLGQGQEEKAAKLLEASRTKGKWVLLQNCHLARSWMGALEKFVEKLNEIPAGQEKPVKGVENTDQNFRMILTSMPESYFPISVLQNGLKLTTEPPRGIKANLKRSLTNVSDKFYEHNERPFEWRKLVISLCFFHAVLQERRKYGALGFNIRYEFNESDLDTAKHTLNDFLRETDIEDAIPWVSLNYMTGSINYGGRVTDYWDSHCLMRILEKFYNEQVLKDDYSFTESGVYRIPRHENVLEMIKYIDQLPDIDPAEIFGLHENAQVIYKTNESNKIIDSILSIQPRIASSEEGKVNDDKVLELIKTIQNTIVPSIDKSTASISHFANVEGGTMSSLSVFLLQEVDRFNNLLKVIKRSLEDLNNAIIGIILISQELDEMYVSFLNNTRPQNWSKVSYPSLKSLGSWIKDLTDRISFLQKWLESEAAPIIFWMPGFYFPQGFITGILQTHARKNKIPIDSLAFRFKTFDTPENLVKVGPKEGVFVSGLYLDGAAWNNNQETLIDQTLGQIYFAMPTINFIPSDIYEIPADYYSCPLYKTSNRVGVLSTTGQSTNFVLPIILRSKYHSPKHWTLRGTALLCQLDD